MEQSNNDVVFVTQPNQSWIVEKIQEIQRIQREQHEKQQQQDESLNNMKLQLNELSQLYEGLNKKMTEINAELASI
jgi:uncharacterized protein (UPF0305 family)